jgi:hypothetical protein
LSRSASTAPAMMIGGPRKAAARAWAAIVLSAPATTR